MQYAGNSVRTDERGTLIGVRQQQHQNVHHMQHSSPNQTHRPSRRQGPESGYTPPWGEQSQNLQAHVVAGSGVSRPALNVNSSNSAGITGHAIPRYDPEPMSSTQQRDEWENSGLPEVSHCFPRSWKFSCTCKARNRVITTLPCSLISSFL